MLGLTAYFDESGHADDPRCRFVGVGGLCAPLATWEAFDEKWQEILNEQCGGHPFHMKAFSFGEGHFKGWDKPRREKLFGALVKTIKESKARPFGAVVSLDAWDYLCKAIPGIDKVLGEPYHWCFQDATRAATVSLLEHSIDHLDDSMEFENKESVAMVYARQKEYGTITSPTGTARESMGRSENLWYAIKDANPYVGRWMGSYASESPDDLNFLQAADLFAYELVHEFENRVNRPADDMRWALSELLPGSWRSFLHKFYGLPQILDRLIEDNILNVTEEQRYGGSTNASLDNIMHRDLLFARMYGRRNKNE
jgi:hypothetical protein